MTRKDVCVAAVLGILLLCGAGGIAPAGAEPVQSESGVALLAPPAEGGGPVGVRARFDLQEITEIDDEAERFAFAGVLTLRWNDPRQAFDPAVAGVSEKVFQGGYQFDELATGWYPQVVLVNDAGGYDSRGVVLRIRPDGSSILVERVHAMARSELDMARFPFDSQRLEAVFEVLGFDSDEVRLVAEPEAAAGGAPEMHVPQWTVGGWDASVRDRAASSAGRSGVSSAFVLGVDVERQSFHFRRLVVLPLVVIVLLSFSVFWMDRSSIGDRLSVSFIGILTVVTYQLVVSEHLPRISYFTLIHAFLSLSFLTMCATVVIHLVVSGLDRRGRSELGDRIDRRCRWVFPLIYFGLLGVIVVLAWTVL